MTDILVLFTGDKDSLLTTAMLAARGYRCHLQTYNNGRIDGIERIGTAIQHLQERYPEKIQVLPIVKTSIQFLGLASKFWQKKVSEIVEEYPNLLPYQLHCLICRSVMYFDAVIYCRRHNIHYIAEGARKSRGFICGTDEMYDRYKDFCCANGVKDLFWPVYLSPTSGVKYESMLEYYGLPSEIFEPQCSLCRYFDYQLTDEELSDLLWYFDNELRGDLQTSLSEILTEVLIGEGA